MLGLRGMLGAWVGGFGLGARLLREGLTCFVGLAFWGWVAGVSVFPDGAWMEPWRDLLELELKLGSSSLSSLSTTCPMTFWRSRIPARMGLSWELVWVSGRREMSLARSSLTSSSSRMWLSWFVYVADLKSEVRLLRFSRTASNASSFCFIANKLVLSWGARGSWGRLLRNSAASASGPSIVWSMPSRKASWN